MHDSHRINPYGAALAAAWSAIVALVIWRGLELFLDGFAPLKDIIGLVTAVLVVIAYRKALRARNAPKGASRA